MAQTVSSCPWGLLPEGSLNLSPLWGKECPENCPRLEEGGEQSLFSPEQPCFRVVSGIVDIPNSLRNSGTYPYSGQNLLTADQQIPQVRANVEFKRQSMLLGWEKPLLAPSELTPWTTLPEQLENEGLEQRATIYIDILYLSQFFVLFCFVWIKMTKTHFELAWSSKEI